MGRPSKLTAKQWATIGERFFAGESARALAREYPVSEAAIRQRFSTQAKDVKTVANQIVAAEAALKSLAPASQCAVIDLAAKLRSISEHLGGAANYGAMTSHRLAGMAHKLTDRIDDTAPMQDQGTLQSIAVLTKIANSSAEVGLNLLRANSAAVEAMNKAADEPPVPKQIVFTVQSA